MKKVIILCLMSGTLVSANEFKVLDINMGDKRGSLPVKSLNCKNKCCDTYTYKKNHHYYKVNNDGNVNKVEVCYDYNNEVYKISLATRVTPETQLIKNWKSIFDGLKKDKSKTGISIDVGYFKAYGNNGAYIDFVDVKRLSSLKKAQSGKNSQALNALKNF